MKVTMMMEISLEVVTEAATEVEGEEEVTMKLSGNHFALCVIPLDTILMSVNLIPQKREGDS